LINIGFTTEGRLATVLIIHSSWGFPTECNLYAIKQFFWHRCRGERRFLQGESLMLNHYFVFVLLYFTFACIVLSKIKKISFLYSCFYLLAFSFPRMGTPENTKLCDFTSTKNNNFICTPIAPPAPEVNFYEIKHALLNLVMKE
jgi:hypothetical protein